MGGKWGTSGNTVASMTLWLNPHCSCSLRHHASTQWVNCDNQLSKFSTHVQMCFRHLQTTGDNSLSALVMLQLECLTFDQTCTSPVKCCMLINRRDRSEGVKLTWLWPPQTDVIWDQVRNQILQNFHENLKKLLDCKFKDVQSSKQSFGVAARQQYFGCSERQNLHLGKKFKMNWLNWGAFEHGDVMNAWVIIVIAGSKPWTSNVF